MDFLRDKIKPMYLKYLCAAFGSSFITSIYGIVDMAIVGQYHGAQGTAAMAVIAPVWNLVYSLGLLMGIGGSILFSTLRGQYGKNDRKSNEFFTAALTGAAALALITWLGIIFFDKELLLFFGAEETLLPLARKYVFPVKFAVPSFLFTQVLTAFLRNDGNPGLATKAVLFGGIFNVVGDYFFVFMLDMGIMGAGLATVIGSVLSLLIMLSHFAGKKNSLHLAKPTALLQKWKQITVTGFSSFFIDVAMGILTILFNRQILKYLGTDALAVYGIIINISTFVQCCAYSIGQASQPIISMNFGAGYGNRIRTLLRYTLCTAALFSIFWTGLSLLAPNLYVRIFMSPDDHILEIAPAIIRVYGLSFLLLPLNIFSTYYFQALMKPLAAFIVSVSRGALISGILIYLLPAFWGGESIWFAMPITELIVAVYAGMEIYLCTKKLPHEKEQP